MRRVLILAACAAAAAGCVSVEGLPDPHGALKTGQRLVVVVYPSPGPWIIGSADTKAEAAAKISPLGFFVQSAENQHTNSVSKNLQQYLPRPRLGQAVQNSLLSALRSVRSTSTVQTGLEAGLAPEQLAEWNKSKDQLDWRQRYYAPDPDQGAPRDYAKVLTLDDAVILDVNVSFGTDANEDGHLLPTMSAAARAYRGDTSHLLWEHEDIVADQTSSATMTDYQMQPWTLTDSLQKLAPTLGKTVAASFLKAFMLAPSTSAPHAMAAAPAGGGLVPMSFFQNMSSSTPAGVAPSTAAPSSVTPSTATIFAVFASTTASPGVLASTAGLSGITASTAAVSVVSAPAIAFSTVAVPASSGTFSAGSPTVSTTTAPSPAAAIGITASTAPAISPPAALPALPGMSPTTAPPPVSAPAVSLSTPTVTVSTSP
ncbi:MAG: hypothetical protein ACHQ2Z_09415 [Elusimicrobiota bacterium]